MNAASIVILAAIGLLAGLCIWRVHKKGAPCECGGSRKQCGGQSCGCCH